MLIILILNISVEIVRVNNGYIINTSCSSLIANDINGAMDIAKEILS